MSTAPESSSRQKQMAQAFFESGNQAALKNQYEYAIQMYRDACKLVPEALLYRQALRGVERRQFGNDPAKVGRMAGAKTQPIKLRARAAKAQGHWGQVLEVCEVAFVHNTWSVSASQDALICRSDVCGTGFSGAERRDPPRGVRPSGPVIICAAFRRAG